METFEVKHAKSEEIRSISGSEGRKHGIRAPGRIVMVVLQGSCRVQLRDGGRESLTAQSVVIWEPGDWVEYGFDASAGFRAESYWQDDLSGEEWRAVFAEVFGPETFG